MKLTALVPMKGHSERVPNKNLKDFNGKPLCYYVLKTLSQVDSIQKIIVNTDSDQIEDCVLSFFPNIVINKRPDAICGDYVPMNDVLNHDIQSTDDEYFLQSHSTNPLMKSETVDAAIQAYCEKLKQGHDSLFSVTPIYNRLYWEKNIPINHNPNALLRTQDLPKVYEENSLLFLFSRESFADNGNRRIGRKPFLFETAPNESIDIDEPYDFELAQLMQKNLKDPNPAKGTL